MVNVPKAGKVAIVTGVSSGIGKASAYRLSEAGYRVFGTSRKAVDGPAPSGFEVLKLDVTQNASVSDLVSEVIEKAGCIDVLVNNAGIGVAGGAEESSPEQASALFETNLFGVIRMINGVLPHMRSRGEGRIVNISSVLGFMPAPFSALYSSSKHALEGYSESLDHELRTFGIRVSLVQPAYTRTSFDTNMLDPDRMKPEYEAARRRTKEMIKRVVDTADDPKTVADVVLRAATDPQPKLRYTAGKLAARLTVMRRFAPAGAFDRSLRSQMKLDA